MNRSKILVLTSFSAIVLGGLGYFFLPWQNVTDPIPFPVSQGVPEARFQRLGMGLTPVVFAQRREYDAAEIGRLHNTADLDAFVEMGVKHIRFAFDAPAFKTATADFKPDPKLFDIFMNWIRECKKRGILVMVFYHPNPPYKESLETNRKEFDQMVKMWSKMTQFLAEFGPDDLVIEPLSEPGYKSPDKWRSDQWTLIKTIRNQMPNHTIIAQGYGYSRANELIALRPYSDSNIVYTFHYYDPFLFTHQGASWIPPEMSDFGLVRYPSDVNNIKSMQSRVKNGAMQRNLDDYKKSAPWNERAIENSLKEVVAWGKKYGAKVTCNEFGLGRAEPVGADRAKWFQDVTTAFKASGIPWTMYAWDGGMGLTYGTLTNPDAYASIDRMSLEGLGFKMPAQPKLGPNVFHMDKSLANDKHYNDGKKK